MKLNTLTSFCLAICLSLCLQASAETSGSAENDINADDLTRDLQRQRSNLQAAPSIPSESEDETAEQTEENNAPWFKVEIIVFKQEVNSVTEEFSDTTEFTPPEPLITLKGYDYPEQHFTRAQHYNVVYSSSSSFNQISETDNATDQSDENDSQAASHIPESAARNAPQENKLLIAYQQEPLELLTDAQTRLEKSQNYQILLATAWKQPTLTKEESPTLHLVAGNWFDDQPEFEAFLKVSKQRYLHAYADLFLKTYSLKTDQPLTLDLSSEAFPTDNETETTDKQSNDTSFENQGIQPHHFKLFNLNIDEEILGQADQHSSSYITNEVYHIKEDRIMKHSKDLYYLDHPKFGMIIKITPLDQLEENNDS